MLLCASFLVIGVVYGQYSATQLNEVFADYKERFQLPLVLLKYSSRLLRFGHDFGVDEAYRKKVFHDNLLYINDSNSKGITPFTHLTNAEFKELMTIKFPREKLTSRHSGNAGKAFKKSTEDLPKSIDYVKKGFVTKVKNQGNCGSCWAFSTTGALEGAYMKATGKLVSLSEQQMVDCSSDYGNYGCSGGDQYPTLQYVRASGLESEKDYPYIEGEGNCTHNPSKNIIKSCAVKPYRVPANSSTDLLKALVENGPISISIDGGSNVFQSYTGGVIDSITYRKSGASVFISGKCGTNINHAVLLVGYDMTAPKPYYLVKNSWGTEWGEKGYVKIAIDKSKEGVCGILSDSSYPSIHL